MNFIGSPRHRAKAKIVEAALNTVREFLTDEMVLNSCRSAEHRWNRCRWCPVLTVLACVWKQLQATACARQVEDWVASLDADEAGGRMDGADFCAARRRLPQAVFQDAMRQVGLKASAQSGLTFKNLTVSIIDGTTVRTPNTPENAKGFGRSSNQNRRSRSPLARLVLLVCAGCGAVLSASIGTYATSEWELFLKMLLELPRNSLLIADRAYGSFLMFALTTQGGSHVLTRPRSGGGDRQARRRGRRLKRLAANDEIWEWDKPRRAHVSRPDLLPGCPDTLRVRLITRPVKRRGYRTWKLEIATSLLDSHAYPADELIHLYLQRWDIESDLRTLKTHYGMERLSGKTPDIVRKEIYSTLLASNCVIAVMGKSSQPVRGLSHTRARRLIVLFAERMVAVATKELPGLYLKLLALIAKATLDMDERPPQPRAIVQRQRTFPVLTTSRKAWRRAHHAA